MVTIIINNIIKTTLSSRINKETKDIKLTKATKETKDTKLIKLTKDIKGSIHNSSINRAIPKTMQGISKASNLNKDMRATSPSKVAEVTIIISPMVATVKTFSHSNNNPKV